MSPEPRCEIDGGKHDLAIEDRERHHERRVVKDRVAAAIASVSPAPEVGDDQHGERETYHQPFVAEQGEDDRANVEEGPPAPGRAQRGGEAAARGARGRPRPPMSASGAVVVASG